MVSMFLREGSNKPLGTPLFCTLKTHKIDDAGEAISSYLLEKNIATRYASILSNF
jgi:hypothetical protein